jgi:hypothetical protein
MSTRYAGTALAAFVDEFIARSSTLRQKQFNRKSIAYRAIGRSQNAIARMAKCCSLDAGRHLTAPILAAILDGCRDLLAEQLRANGVSDPEFDVATFERDICEQQTLSPTGRAEPDDFNLTQRFEAAMTAAEFGIPDILAWQEGTFAFNEKLRTTQARSVEVMKYLVPRIARTHDASRKLDLLAVTLSIAALNHPGTRWHDSMRRLALKAAEYVDVDRLASGNGVSVEISQRALGHLIDLRSLSFLPTLDSPANAVQRYTLRGTYLPDTLWLAFQRDVENTLQATANLLRLDSTNARAHLCCAAYLSQKARLLAATGHPAHVREARKLEEQSKRHASRCSYPEGLIFPIQECLVKGNTDAALKQCEMAILSLEQSQRHTAATAFAALFLQITSLRGETPTTDRRIRELAREAINCSSTRYQYSHIFDAASSRRLLGPGRPPRTSNS